MTLPTHPLGNSGMHITRVGFGSWAVGGGGWSYGWGPQDDAASLATMRHALKLGVNWIDTAAIYGLGHSEEVVGQLLREMPHAERPLIFTKCGLVWDERDRMQPPQRNLHWPDTGTSVEDSWAAMVKLMEEGKVRAAGVSNFDAALLERCEAIRHVDSLQPPFSLIDRTAAEKEIPWCASHDTGVICYSPMQSGLLTESFTAERVAALAEDDWRRRAAEFQQPRLGRNLALRDALLPIAQRHETSVSCIAIAWALSWPGVSGAIVGARTPKQVDGWIGAAAIKLTRRDLDEIAAAIRHSNAGTGPGRSRRSRTLKSKVA